MKLQEIKTEVKKVLEETDENKSSVKSGVILLAGLFRPHRIKDISEFTGYDYNFCKERISRIKKNGIWKKGKVYCEWDDKKSGGVAFVLDVLAAEGLVERSKAKSS